MFVSFATPYAIQVSTVGVTGTRANVSGKVQSLLQDIKKVCSCIILFFFMLLCEVVSVPKYCPKVTMLIPNMLLCVGH